MFRTYIGAQSGVHKLDGEGLTYLGLEEHTFWAIYAFNDAQGHVPQKDLLCQYKNSAIGSRHETSDTRPVNSRLYSFLLLAL